MEQKETLKLGSHACAGDIGGVPERVFVCGTTRKRVYEWEMYRLLAASYHTAHLRSAPARRKERVRVRPDRPRYKNTVGRFGLIPALCFGSNGRSLAGGVVKPHL